MVLCLRWVVIPRGSGTSDTVFDIYQGDIRKDYMFWLKNYNVKARYFKLVEL